MRRCALAAISLMLAIAGEAYAAHRSYAAKAEFKRMHPCPANNKRSGPCPGYDVDHAIPLKCGGADNHANMQWLSIERHKEKTKIEAKICRSSPS